MTVQRQRPVEPLTQPVLTPEQTRQLRELLRDIEDAREVDDDDAVSD